MPSFILQVANRILVGLILVFAVYLLFRGHNAPGRRFFRGAGGCNRFFAVCHRRGGPSRCGAPCGSTRWSWVATGLLLAISAGLWGAVAGLPFLTGLWWPAGSAAPAVGTPLVFDLGVFLVVLGSILTLVLGLEES